MERVPPHDGPGRRPSEDKRTLNSHRLPSRSFVRRLVTHHINVPLSVVLSHVCELIPDVPFLEPEDGCPAKNAVALPTFSFDRLRIPKTFLHFVAEDRVAFLHEIRFR